MTFKINYDRDVDSAYFRLENQAVLDSEEIAEGVIIDYDENNHIIGVELLGVTTIKPENFALLLPLLPESFKQQILESLAVFKAIESGLRDSETGRVLSVEDVKAKFG